MIHAESVKAWEAETDALRAEIKRLRLALEEIVSPLHFMQERAALNGDRLNGEAYSIAHSVPHLQSIARAALKLEP